MQFRVRCLRSARCAIHQHMTHRWSTLWLRRAWDYCGHRARASTAEVVPGWAVLNDYRSLPWWQQQQALHNGIRHTHRFFPRLGNEERALNRAARGEWRRVAQDRHRWSQLQSAWVDQEDLPWRAPEARQLHWHHDQRHFAQERPCRLTRIGLPHPRPVHWWLRC